MRVARTRGGGGVKLHALVNVAVKVLVGVVSEKRVKSVGAPGTAGEGERG